MLLMTVAATTSAKKTRSTRKRSTSTTPRKASTTKKTVTKAAVVTKYSQPVEIKKVTEPTPAPVVTKEAPTRPEKPNLTYVDYVEDAKVRWAIHSYETRELWSDIVKVYNKSVPVVQSAITYVKDSYDKAFNTETEKK